MPPAGVERRAFSTRFESAWSTRSGSPTALASGSERVWSPTRNERAAISWRWTASTESSARSSCSARTENERRRSRARSSRSPTSRSRRRASRSITSPAASGSSTPSSSASAWPRIAVSGVFSSWLTESRNVRSASCALSSSPERWLNELASVATSRGPATGSGSGRSPAARARLASETRATGRETARESRNATAAARAAPTRPASPRPRANGVQSAAWLAAGRSRTIASSPLRRAA